MVFENPSKAMSGSQKVSSYLSPVSLLLSLLPCLSLLLSLLSLSSPPLSSHLVPLTLFGVVPHGRMTQPKERKPRRPQPLSEASWLHLRTVHVRQWLLA
jgi:hypothetical protein